MEQTNQTDTSAVQTPTVPQISMPTSALMTTLMALIDNYIKDIVTEQVTAILTNHRTLRVIDEGFDFKIKEIARVMAEEVVMQAIQSHNDDEYHISKVAINDMVVSAVEDHDFDSKINDAVHDAINDWDFTDLITASIKDNITFSVSVD